MEALIATLRSPGPNLFEIGPLVLRWYGLLIAASVLIGLNLSSALAIQRGLKYGIINDLLPILVLSSIVGARSYYVAFQWADYKYNLISTLAIWKGGIAIHGAIIGGTISLLMYCRFRNQPFWDILDVLVPSLALGQAIGRWGNFFNNEAFGLPTELPWKLAIPYIYRPEAFASDQYFHPTFLYESVWNLLIFSILIILFKRGFQGFINLPSGSLSCIYLITYSIGRFFIEGLRTDPLCIFSSAPLCEGGLRIAQIMSFVLAGIGLLGIWWVYGLKKKMPELKTKNRIAR